MRATWIITPIIAVSLTTSAFAQGGLNTRQQIDQIVAEYHDAWNRHDAAGIAALYTKEGIIVSQAPQMVKHGQQDIVKNYEGVFATVPHHDLATADEIIPLGADTYMSVGEYHLTNSSNNKLDGHWTAVYVPEGGKLKIRMLTPVPDPPPAPTAR